MEKSKPKVLVLGATGMAGHVVYNFLDRTKQYCLYNTVFRKELNSKSIICDIRNAGDLEEKIESLRPNYIINCIGALIRESKSNPDNTVLLNSWLPLFLSKLAVKYNFNLIHISTDCVFSGKKGSYRVDDFRDADDLYGRSKAIGELNNNRDLTIRTSIIGPELKQNGEGLFHWFLNQDQEVFGFKNAYWSGITTLELAKQINFFIENFNPGLINVAPENKISKYDLLQLLKREFNLNVVINEECNVIIDKSLIPSLGITVPSYEVMIKELYLFMQEWEKLYKHYI